MSVRQRGRASLCQCVSVSVCQCVSVWVRQCASASESLKCQCVSVSGCQRVSVSVSMAMSVQGIASTGVCEINAHSHKRIRCLSSPPLPNFNVDYVSMWSATGVRNKRPFSVFAFRGTINFERGGKGGT